MGRGQVVRQRVLVPVFGDILSTQQNYGDSYIIEDIDIWYS